MPLSLPIPKFLGLFSNRGFCGGFLGSFFFKGAGATFLPFFTFFPTGLLGYKNKQN